MARRMRILEQSLKNMQGLSGQKSVSYTDLCMFPHVHLPVGFKTPKFEKYDGHGDPIAHLKKYCNQLRGASDKEELLMAYFGESLVGIASEWYMDQDISRWHIWDDLARDFVRLFQYNIDITPDRNSLSNLKKKPSESSREYSIKWREQASRVKPPMDEIEMSLRQGKIQHHLLTEPVSGVLRVEGHDTNDYWTLKRAVENLIEQEKIVLRDEEVPNVTNNPLPAHNNGLLIGMICEDKEFDPALKAIIAIVNAEKKLKAAPKQEKGEKKTNTVKVELEKKAETKTETMVPSKNEVLYVPRGRSEKPQRFEMKRGMPMYVSKGAYVVRGTIRPPRLNEPAVIGRVPQKPMTDPSTIPWNYHQTLVTYKGKEITRELPENTSAGKYSDIQEVNNVTRKRFPPKKPVSAEEAEAFFQKMNIPDYAVVDQLRKYPEQVSMLFLLMRSAEHQKILLKTLNEAYVPAETSVEQLERMTERFFVVNQVSFSKNDLPPEGAAHNKALHLTVKCEDYYVKRSVQIRNNALNQIHWRLLNPTDILSFRNLKFLRAPLFTENFHLFYVISLTYFLTRMAGDSSRDNLPAVDLVQESAAQITGNRTNDKENRGKMP
ncbi:uncharacterized protein [Nicotiana sylvestris]|uniref:uncharacterized protein n=1 Tax=Nicotiana sylvestris TaxID=4096 RepID=UPI00388C971B